MEMVAHIQNCTCRSSNTLTQGDYTSTLEDNSASEGHLGYSLTDKSVSVVHQPSINTMPHRPFGSTKMPLKKSKTVADCYRPSEGEILLKTICVGVNPGDYK